MSEKLYRVQMNSSGMPNFATAVEVDSPQGEWIEIEVVDPIDGTNPIEGWQSARCSKCGKYHTTPHTYYFYNFNYCPNCGAHMKGADDEDCY